MGSGTAKGGIGVDEGQDDLQPFGSREFVQALFGVNIPEDKVGKGVFNRED